ncbi:MAG: hypothetical protein KKH94_08920 [Candidatus Omnitrophica bacterium]|nr:hypothetical protein [Candidatus Omnitrophota bacterium]
MKKKEKPLFKRIRRQWIIDPQTQVKKSKKKYNRQQKKTVIPDDDERDHDVGL